METAVAVKPHHFRTHNEKGDGVYYYCECTPFQKSIIIELAKEYGRLVDTDDEGRNVFWAEIRLDYEPFGERKWGVCFTNKSPQDHSDVNYFLHCVWIPFGEFVSRLVGDYYKEPSIDNFEVDITQYYGHPHMNLIGKWAMYQKDDNNYGQWAQIIDAENYVEDEKRNFYPNGIRIKVRGNRLLRERPDLKEFRGALLEDKWFYFGDFDLERIRDFNPHALTNIELP